MLKIKKRFPTEKLLIGFLVLAIGVFASIGAIGAYKSSEVIDRDVAVTYEPNQQLPEVTISSSANEQPENQEKSSYSNSDEVRVANQRVVDTPSNVSTVSTTPVTPEVNPLLPTVDRAEMSLAPTPTSTSRVAVASNSPTPLASANTTTQVDKKVTSSPVTSRTSYNSAPRVSVSAKTEDTKPTSTSCSGLNLLGVCLPIGLF